jgi:hypothetical protein
LLPAGDSDSDSWLADPDHLDSSDPFVVGGTNLLARDSSALVAVVNPGRAGANDSTLNRSSSAGAQQAEDSAFPPTELY